MNHRVPIFTPEGRHITTLKGHNQLSQWARDKLAPNPDRLKQRVLGQAWDPEWEKRFALACAVKVDDQDRIAIVENSRSRVQVYKKTKTPAIV